MACSFLSICARTTVKINDGYIGLPLTMSPLVFSSAILVATSCASLCPLPRLCLELAPPGEVAGLGPGEGAASVLPWLAGAADAADAVGGGVDTATKGDSSRSPAPAAAAL